MNIIRVKAKEWIVDEDTQTPTKAGQKLIIYIDQIDPVTIAQIAKLFDAVVQIE